MQTEENSAGNEKEGRQDKSAASLPIESHGANRRYADSPDLRRLSAIGNSRTRRYLESLSCRNIMKST